MRSVRSPWRRNSRKACAVVANPPGTRTPLAASWLIISPRLAFLPPTASTSVILSSSSGTTRAVASEVDDMGELREGEQAVLSGTRRERTPRYLGLWLGSRGHSCGRHRASAWVGF